MMNSASALLALALAMILAPRAGAAEPRPTAAPTMSLADLDRAVGQPVELSPWAYAWRADRAVQEKPEACFIPRRLERIDKVYRTALPTLGPDQMKSIYYQQPDLLVPLPPAPKGRLLAGLLWTGGLSSYQVELHWPAEVKDVPAPEAIEVRVYPTAFGWFGWTVDEILNPPNISADGRTWTYTPKPGLKMDCGYNLRPDAATEMVGVFADAATTATTAQPAAATPSAIPEIRVTGPSLGAWKRMDIEIEWGFQPGAEHADFDGRLESHVALLGHVAPLPGDEATSMTGASAWQSRPAAGARRGIAVPVLYAPDSRPGLDSRVTVWTRTAGFTIRLRDLENGPVLIPEQGIFVTKAGGNSAAQFSAELAARNLKTIRQLTREHREAASWDEVLREVRLWQCPEGTAVPPFPPTPAPAMEIEVPDERWVGMWRTATDQLRGPHMWGNLAFEVARVARAMEMVGLHAESNKVYDYFLASPGVKSDGDYSDPSGSLEWAKSMRHDMGYSHEGTHCSTGRLLFAMSERYFLTGDKAWFEQRLDRLRAAADWIIRERTGYLKDVPNRGDLLVAGLMPPSMIGDYILPGSDWHWYYVDNAFSLQGLRRFADAVLEIDPKAGRQYRAEADAFEADLRRAVERDAALAPVRLARDGTYRSYIPRMAYGGGVTGPELGAPQYPEIDLFMGALPLAEPFAALDPNDQRIIDTLDVMEELGTSDYTPQQVAAMPTQNQNAQEAQTAALGALDAMKAGRRQRGLDPEEAWFWKDFVGLPKASHNANLYLLQDDVPNFLRFLMNTSIAMVGANGKLWEHWHLNQYADCDNPDNGTSGWFLENFRNMLVMESGDALWIARGTPRAWLEQGKAIRVSKAPTYFGTLAYEIVSDVDKGEIRATIEVPARRAPGSIILRLRHPDAAPIQSIAVEGQAKAAFDPEMETITFDRPTGAVTVTARY